MTVPTSDNREEYEGNDATTVFPYAFKIFEESDLQAFLQDADGDQTPLVLNTDYSVSGAGNVNGGNVTYPLSGDELATGEKLILLRIVDITQETDLRNQGAYYPQTLEDELDRSRMIDQQQQEEIDRALKQPEAEEPYDAGSRKIENLADGVNPNDAVNKSQQDSRFANDVITKTGTNWDGKGARAVNFQTSNTPQNDELVNSQYLEAYVASVIAGGEGVIPETYFFDGDGSTTVFSVPGITALDPSSYTVTIDGLDQKPGTEYTVDVGTETVTFAEAPPAPFPGEDENIMVRVLAYKRAISEAQNAIVDTGTGIQTVPEAIDARVIRVSSRTEMKAYDVPAGYQFSLEEGGRSGIFVVKSGTPPADTLEGIYVVLNNGNYAERVNQDYITPLFFGAVVDGVTDDSASIQAAIDYASDNNLGGVYFPAGDYRVATTLTVYEEGFRIHGAGVEDSALLIDSGVTGLLVEPTAGFTVNVAIDHLELTSSGLGSGGISRGIRVRNNSRKIFISYCRIHELDYGILVNDSWSVFVHDCHINNNNRNIAAYRTIRDDTSPTTIYIYNNSIMNFVSGKGYSISIGEPGQDDYQAGEQCSTLVLRENVMDGSHCFQLGATNTHWVRNHAENSRSPNDPFLLVDGSVAATNLHFKDNVIWNYDFGVSLDGTSYTKINIKGNWFRLITYTAVKIPDSFNADDIVENNDFTSVNRRYEFAVRTSNREYAEIRQGIEGKKLYLSGNVFTFVTTVPSSGRYKHGDQIIVRDNTSAFDRSYFFEAGGSNATALGITNVGATDETGDTDSGSNTVTPTNINAFEAGDRLLITGADTASGDLSCVIISIDSVNGTFATLPSIKTNTTGTNIAFEGASSSNFRQIAKGSSLAALDVEGSEGGIAARFNSSTSKTVPTGTTVLETLGIRSAYLIYIRDTTNSSTFLTSIVATSVSGGFVDNRIDQTSANFSIAMSGLDLELSNPGTSRDYAYSIIRLDGD